MKLFAAMFAGVMILIAVAVLNGLAVADVPASAYTQIVAEIYELQKMAAQIAKKNDFLGMAGVVECWTKRSVELSKA